jgi:DNA-binding protein H-NS
MNRANIESLKYAELLTLQSQIKDAIAVRKGEERTELKRKLSDLATKNGFSVEELYGKARNKKPSEVKFRHPKDPSLTWTGRGRKPSWLNEAVKKGAMLESFAL